MTTFDSPASRAVLLIIGILLLAASLVMADGGPRGAGPCSCQALSCKGTAGTCMTCACCCKGPGCTKKCACCTVNFDCTTPPAGWTCTDV